MAITKIKTTSSFTNLTKYDSFLAGNNINDYESIATVTVGAGGAASVTFSSIPSTYQHLQIRALVRTNRAAASDSVYWRFNSDSATNYTIHSLYGNGTSALTDNGVNLNYGYYIGTTAASATSSVFAVAVIDILDYKDTNKFKTVRTLHGKDVNGTGEIFLTSSLWRNTAALSSMTLESQNAANISEYSSFALYGIRG
jgi:hypothetical protein